jgi:Mu transposase-like protein
LPETLVWDRHAGLYARDGRPRCVRRLLRPAEGRLVLLAGGRSAGRGRGRERLQGYAETDFEPGRRFADHLDFQRQLDAWFEKVNARQHRTLRCRPIDRLVEEREVMAPLSARPPDTDRRWVLRVAPDPYLRLDTCDYSLDPTLVGRRIEARVTDGEVLAVALDTGELVVGTSAASPSTARARPHAARAARRGPPAPRSRSGRWSATTP